MADLIAPQSSLKALIAKGKEQGYLTYSEVNDHLPKIISDPDQVEDIIQMINDMGIQVFEQAPDADELMPTKEIGLPMRLPPPKLPPPWPPLRTEAGRTTDPVRMYMREMGTVELLTREGEIVIAKRIEEGIRELHGRPGPLSRHSTNMSRRIRARRKEERRLTDIIVGYLDSG